MNVSVQPRYLRERDRDKTKLYIILGNGRHIMRENFIFILS
jgi:hypothetical protein